MATLVNAPGTPFHGAHVRRVDGAPDEHGRIPVAMVGYEGEATLYVPVQCLIDSEPFTYRPGHPFDALLS